MRIRLSPFEASALRLAAEDQARALADAEDLARQAQAIRDQARARSEEIFEHLAKAHGVGPIRAARLVPGDDGGLELEWAEPAALKLVQKDDSGPTTEDRLPIRITRVPEKDVPPVQTAEPATAAGGA